MDIVISSETSSQLQELERVDQLAVYHRGEVIAMMWERDDGTVAMTRAGEPDFQRIVSRSDLNVRNDVRQVTLS